MSENKAKRLGGVTLREDEAEWLDAVLRAIAIVGDRGFDVLTRHQAYASLRRKTDRIVGQYRARKEKR